MTGFYNIFSSLPGLDKNKTFVKPNSDSVVIIHLFKFSKERFEILAATGLVIVGMIMMF